ncbi:uncharacterized protein [Diabrotica undecimpunctata]|uniref:uncharacterized protein isoform X3 n=1 Tax=Diabrotica undecimpunctata TaxID=50387 RepID=UPI003B639FFF
MMDCKLVVITVIYLGGLAAQQIPVKRQVNHATTAVEKEDHVPAETGFINPAAAVHSGSKFFQYIHVPAKDHVEHGHKRGNDHHFIERHEKEHPHAGEFKTKVRWGDKHGGYGEHYWDYNHAGHGHDGEGDESQQNEEYAEYEDESKNEPIISSLSENQRGKREPALLDDVEFINDKARSLSLDRNSQRHGGNYRAVNDNRGKREQSREKSRRVSKNFGESLVFDADEGIVLDEETGLRYQLSPLK